LASLEAKTPAKPDENCRINFQPPKLSGGLPYRVLVSGLQGILWLFFRQVMVKSRNSAKLRLLR
jgi:hypothetical protein